MKIANVNLWQAFRKLGMSLSFRKSCASKIIRNPFFIAFLLIAAFISSAYAATDTSTTKTPVIAGLNEDADDANKTDQINTDSIFSHEGLSISEYQDSVLGFVGMATVSSYLFDNQHAAALELNGGPRIFRLNATYGFNLTNNQRIKVTGERLDEKLDFDFTTDTVSQWVGQNALGADYAYMLENKFLQSLGFGGYYTHSPSKDLSSETIHDSVNNLDYLEQRRIAGANSGNFHTDVATHLWPYSRLSGGVDYDKVHFDTQYTSDQDVQGFGGHAKVEQRLFPTVKLTVGSDMRQTERGYSAGISWLTPSIKGLQSEIEAVTDFTNDLTAGQRYYTTGLRLNLAFDDNVGGSHQATYSDLSEEGAPESLLDWTRTPSVRMSTVLAVADGSTVATFMSCPATVAFESNSGGLNYFTAPGGWHGSADEFNGDGSDGGIVFDLAKYLPGPATAKCIYNVDGNTDALILYNDNAGQQVGNGWIEKSGSYNCSGDANQCHFKDKRIVS